MKKLPTTAFAIAAALVALLPVGGYQHRGSRDQYEIVINLSDFAAVRESASNPRPGDYEEPA